MKDAPLSRTQLMQIQAIIDVSINRLASELGLHKPYLSLKQCYDKYGRATVDRWADEGLIEIIKDGPRNNKCRVNREKIELVAATSNRASYYEHHE